MLGSPDEINRWVRLIDEALADLAEAVRELRAPTVPRVPMPRPKLFCFTRRVRWPLIERTVDVAWDVAVFSAANYPLNGFRHALADRILDDCEYNPRLVLRAIRRIQAATAWCRARAEGRKRAARELRRQQSKFFDALDAHEALSALSAEGR